jgi:hypothetical protein
MFLFALTATWMIFLFEMIFSALFKLCFIFAIHFVLFYPSWRKVSFEFEREKREYETDISH